MAMGARCYMALRLGLVDRHRIGWHEDVAMC